MTTSAARLALAWCLGLMPAMSDSPPSPAALDTLLGIWAYETTFGSVARGELEVRRGSRWSARLGSAEVAFEVTGDEVRFELPGGVGQFRGKLTESRRAIEGFWLRPAITGDPRHPGGSTQAFATPLALRRADRSSWRGDVRPLENRFTLYLTISRDADGTVVGAFRNPEQHSHGPAMQYRVTREGDAVRFRAQSDPAEPELRVDAALAQAPERLQVQWPDLGRVVELTRRDPAEAADFFPRPPGGSRYLYRVPPATGDGWQTAPAKDAGIDEAALARLVQRLSDADPGVRRPSLIHSLLVARRGKLVLEEYFFGFDRDTPHDLRSAGKTFASVMLGAAMTRGIRIGPDTSAYDLLADMGPFANPDSRKSRITLAHLMTHTAGLACDDNDDSSPGNEITLQSQRLQPDWWKFTLDLPLAHDPGSRYAYCSANTNLMGAALTTATSTWLPEWFDLTVAQPLQFGPYHWNLMPTGEGYLGGGAWLRPRDLLKVGQTYLDGGVWRGRRVVDAAWVARSTASHVQISPATTGLDAEQFSERYFEGADGYAWHLGEVRSGQRSYRHYAATGNGGQILLVIPEVELVVVFTGGNYRQGGIWGRWADEIVGGEIIPALRR